MARKTPTVKNNTLTFQSENAEQTLVVGSSEWFGWLEGVGTFAYNGETGHFTARKEQVGNQRGGFYWKAYRSQGGRLARVYLGKNSELTNERLEEAATRLNEKSSGNPSKDKEDAPLSDIPPGKSPKTSGKLPSETLLLSPPLAQPQESPAPTRLASEQSPVTTASAGLPLALLATKLFVPVGQPRQVVRSRLLTKLEDSRAAKLVLISAPAGFGKTTLVTEWLEWENASGTGRGRANAWLALDEGDNDQARFWFYFASALEPWAAGLGQAMLNQFQQLQLPGREQVLTRLLNQLSALSQPVRLVLDDYHLIENRAIHDDMNFLLDHLPPNLQIVLTTRHEPPLALSRLRVRRQLVELRAEDLRFSTEEAAHFFSDVIGIELRPAQVAVLEKRTEGWAAALQLAGLSIQSRADIDGFITNIRDNRRFILDYLNEEVLAAQSADTRNFLLQTSVLNRFNAELAEELTGCSDGRAMLKKLEQSNLFLVPLDHEGQWYRYHHLFADYLFGCLQQEQPEHVPLLQRWAAEWFATHNLPGESVEYALTAKNYEYAATVLESITFETIRLGEMRTVTGWLEALPEEVIARHFSLWIDYMVVLLSTIQIDKAEHELEVNLPKFMAYRQAQAEPLVLDTPTQGILHFFKAYIAENRGDFNTAYEFALKARDEIDENDVYMRQSIAITLATANITRGNFIQTEAELQRILAQGRLADRLGDNLMAMFTLCYSLVRRGNLRQTRNYAEQILELSKQPLNSEDAPTASLQLSYPVIMAHFVLSEVAREGGDMETAGSELAQMFETTRAAGSVEYEYTALVYQARQHLDRKDLESVRQSLIQANVFEQNHTLKNSRAIMIGMLRVIIWLALGELETAKNLLESYEELRKTYFYDLDELYQLASLKILLAEGKYIEAEEASERLLSTARQAELIRTMIETLQIQAIIQKQNGQNQAALDKLAEALRLGEPQNYIATFAAEYPAIEKLFTQIYKSPEKFGLTRPYLNKILKFATTP